MPEVQEGTTSHRLKRFLGDFTAQLKGESKLSHSIGRQKEILEEIAKAHADDKQGEEAEGMPEAKRKLEAERMLKVINYYEKALRNPKDQTGELEQAINNRVIFLWETLSGCTEFNLSNPANPCYEILPPKEHPKEEHVDRWRRAKGYAAINFQELKGNEAEWFGYVKRIEAKKNQFARNFRAWNFYLEFQPGEEKPYRQVIIQFDPNPTPRSEDIFSVKLTTNKRGLKKQEVEFKLDRRKNKIMIDPRRIMWQPVIIQNKEISGWDREMMEIKGWDSDLEIRGKRALALAIAKELFETTQVSEEEIEELIGKVNLGSETTNNGGG